MKSYLLWYGGLFMVMMSARLDRPSYIENPWVRLAVTLVVFLIGAMMLYSQGIDQ